MPRFRHETLAEFASAVLTAAGMRTTDAWLVASLLIKADLRGYPAHGIAHLPAYLNRIREGLIDIAATPELGSEGPSYGLVDGHFAFGQVVGDLAMKAAIEKGRANGIAIVGIKNSGHMGRLADYVEMAADTGLIGTAALSLSSASIPPHGGMTGVAGTNPVAYGVPAREGRHFVLDFATAASSRGELTRRAALGEPIPEGVLLDADGNPTTSFQTGRAGSILLPFGGYRGSGLHLVTEFLAGILPGHGLGRDWGPKAPGGSIQGGFFQVIDPGIFRPLDEFLDDVDEFLSFVKSSRPQPGFDEVLIPGERARAAEAQRLIDGIVVHEEEWRDLLRWAADLGVEAPAADF